MAELTYNNALLYKRYDLLPGTKRRMKYGMKHRKKAATTMSRFLVISRSPLLSCMCFLIDSVIDFLLSHPFKMLPDVPID